MNLPSLKQRRAKNKMSSDGAYLPTAKIAARAVGATGKWHLTRRAPTCVDG